MKTLNIGREKISINQIGHKRFWFGLIFGVFVSIILSLVFNNVREVFRFITSFNSDLFIPTDKELKVYNLFFASIASIIGLATSLWIWLTKRNKKRQRFINLAQLYIVLIIWTTLMILTRMGTILSFLVYRLIGIDNNLYFTNNFIVIIMLFPIIIFLQSWFMVRMVYKSLNWILYSFIFIIIQTFILSVTTKIDQDIINKPYHNLFKTEYTFIDNQIEYSKINYNIHFDDNTINLLKKRYAEGSIKLVESVKNEFSKDKKIKLDTIILEKIIIHNLKQGINTYDSYGEDWYYAKPINIYRQILKYEIEDNETKELFLILKEQIDLLNFHNLEWDKEKNFTIFETNKDYFLINGFYPETIINELNRVREDLISNKKYEKYHHLLPIINKKTYY